jgi:Rrf2 family protein
MAYSQAFTQAVTIVVYISIKMNYKNNTQYLATKYISDKLNIPVPTANKVIRSMILSGIIVSKEGARGGLMLAKKPENITLYDIFKSIEHDIPLFKPIQNLNITGIEIENYKKRINGSLLQAEIEMKEALGKITIKQLLK